MLKGDFHTNFTSEEMHVRNLLKQVSHVTSQVPGANAAQIVMCNQICGLMIEKGLPSFYLIINPTNVCNPIVKFLAGSDIDIDRMTADQVPTSWSQSVLVANNPIVCAKFFNIYMEAFVKALLGFRGVDAESDVGILGCVSAYYGCVEAQGRGSLHCHILVWLAGSLNPNEIRDRIMHVNDTIFRNNLLAFLEDTISMSVPNDPLPDDDIPSSLFHPSSVRAPLMEGDLDSVRHQLQKDVHFLAQSSQVYHHTHTCFKYWQGHPEPKQCRFDLDERNNRPISTVNEETGEIMLQCLDGMVNHYNATMLAALQCNMDIQFIRSGQSAKAILYYVTDYITKTQLKMHVPYAALERAVSKIGEYDPSMDVLALRAKWLLQKCTYSMH